MKAMRFLASLIVILSAGLALPHEAHATPKSPPLHHTRLLKPVHANGVNQDSYSFLVLNETNYLWSDGHGDETLDQTLLGLSTPGASDTTWCFDWDSGAYSNIRANDDSGPLTVNYYTDPSNSSGVCADVDFRYEVDTGEQYHFILYITIGGMASGSAPDWEANWYTEVGGGIGRFLETLTLPSSSTITSVSPTPASRSANVITWEMDDTSPGDQISIDVTYTVSNTMTVQPLLQGQYPCTGPQPSSIPWANDLYAWHKANETPPGTICEWGCYLTSAAMLVNYRAQADNTQPSAPVFQTDPGALNQQLEGLDGYDSDNGVDPLKVASYAQRAPASLHLYYAGAISSRNDTILTQYLQSGDPVILGVDPTTCITNGRSVPCSGHWVLATGITVENGTSTFQIDDPVWGQTTLLDHHANTYREMRLFTNVPINQTLLTIGAFSPVELLVTDPQGRTTGFDPATDTTLDEIPGSSYLIEGISPIDGSAPDQVSKSVEIDAPSDGSYQIQIIGTGAGPYTVSAVGANWNGQVTTSSTTGVAQVGSSQVVSVTYTAAQGLAASVLYLPLISR